MTENDESIVNSPIFWMRCLELFMCVICFGLTVQYPETEALMFDHAIIAWTDNTTAIDIFGLINLTEAGFVRLHFLTLSTVGFTWIIIPAILLSYVIHGRKDMDKNVMCIILNGVGFLIFLVAGSLVCTNFSGSWDSGAKSTGVMCIFTSFLFLTEVCYVVYQNLKVSRSLPGQ